MTLPRERTWSLLNTRQFLVSLLNPKETPRIPRKIRKTAGYCLRHFPVYYEIDRLAKKVPHILESISKKVR